MPQSQPAKTPRSTEVLVVGDLHGNIEIMYANLLSLGAIDEFNSWV